MDFHFNISLSVLNHLGRNLYRSFSTVLGEAISNSWDADAENVYITIDREKSIFTIEDDGCGMTSDDFQNKFLKVGYSKRQNNISESKKGRPFIGRKGIGKLALLSCAEKIHIFSKTEQTPLIKGMIDNTKLDKAITEDSDYYKLEETNPDFYNKRLNEKSKGTLLVFENVNQGINNKVEYLRKIIALFFRFSTIDPNFNIYVNNEKITDEDLEDVLKNTQFVWNINDTKGDSYLDKANERIKKEYRNIRLPIDLDNKDTLKGFFITVDKPSSLKIRGTGESLSVDLYVNGRLREQDIMKHIPTHRIPQSYLYGQIHYNSLDDGIDRFTSSREGVKADDPKLNNLLEKLKEAILKIFDQWDEFRLNESQDGDVDNTKKITKKERKAKELYNETAAEFYDKTSTIKDDLEKWIKEFEREAQFNIPSYTECFLAENLTRRFIEYKMLEIPQDIQKIIDDYRNKEQNAKQKGGITIEIRAKNDDKSYLDMSNLASIADDQSQKSLPNSFSVKAKEYKPIRDAMMHTALLTNEAKTKMTATYNDIKAKIKFLLK